MANLSKAKLLLSIGLALNSAIVQWAAAANAVSVQPEPANSVRAANGAVAKAEATVVAIGANAENPAATAAVVSTTDNSLSTYLRDFLPQVIYPI